MRIGLTAIFLAIILSNFSNATSLDKKIQKHTKEFEQKERESQKLSSALSKVAREILKEQKKIEELKKKIVRLDENIKEQQSEFELKKKELEELKKSTSKLIKTKQELERKLIDIILKNFAVTLISKDNNYNESVNSLITNEVFKAISTMTKQKFAKIQKSYMNTVLEIKNKQEEIKKIERYISTLNAKKEKLNKLKKKETKIVAKLNKKRKRYKERLSRIQKEQEFIRATLRKLKILKEEKQKEAEVTKRAKALSSQNVRRIGSSYQTTKTKRYMGEKTIPPLKDFIVKRKFGNYYDPVYKMKIYNESVILKPLRPNEKVRNILDGKVVFAKDTPLLDKVIVIEHKNGLHTIYAHLSKIAPTVKVGKRIKKGAVIGRVDRELSLEVTQQNYHIDPLELIRVN